MSLFQCHKCGCVENTTLADYWIQHLEHVEHNQINGTSEDFKPKCSVCLPTIGEWHGRFKRKPAIGYMVDKRGFLWSGNEYGDIPQTVGVLVGIGEIQYDEVNISEQIRSQHRSTRRPQPL